MAYTKLFSSIITSTIWSEDDRTRIVWITMLAMADKNGEVQGSVPGLARVAGVPVEDCRAAIGKFLSPDLDSRTKDDEGRRVEEIEGGWVLLNHRKYREMASDADRNQKAAIRQQRARDKAKAEAERLASRSRHAPVTLESHQNPQAEAEAYSKEEESNTNKKKRESLPLPPLALFWNNFDSLPKIQTWTKSRKTALANRMHDPFFAENWQHAITKAAESTFLTGSNDRGWKADIGWFLQPDSIAKVMEGKYSTATVPRCERKPNPSRYGTFEQVKAMAMSGAVPVTMECAEMFFDRMEEIGWVDDKGLPLADWRARFRRYVSHWNSNAQRNR